MAGPTITATWNELLAIGDGAQVINLIRACLVATAKRREADERAPAGYLERVYSNLDDLTNMTYIAAAEANAEHGDLPAPVAATRGANRVLCKLYRASKRPPTVSLDDRTTAMLYEYHAIGRNLAATDAVIVLSDLLTIAQDHAGKGDRVKRRKFVKTVWSGFCRAASKQHAGLNGHAVLALERQIEAYSTT